MDTLPSAADVLELGCGGGAETTQKVAERFNLIGVDISERQIELARLTVPLATFVCDDMTRVEVAAQSFDAVPSFYAFNHLPFGELEGLLARIAGWLKPGGLLVTALASKFDPGVVEADWLGAPMYFSGYAPGDTRRFVEDAGLSIVSLQPEPIVEIPVGWSSCGWWREGGDVTHCGLCRGWWRRRGTTCAAHGSGVRALLQ